MSSFDNSLTFGVMSSIDIWLTFRWKPLCCVTIVTLRLWSRQCPGLYHHIRGVQSILSILVLSLNLSFITRLPVSVFEGFSSSGLSWLYFVLRLWLRNKHFLLVILHSYDSTKRQFLTSVFGFLSVLIIDYLFWYSSKTPAIRRF